MSTETRLNVTSGLTSFSSIDRVTTFEFSDINPKLTESIDKFNFSRPSSNTSSSSAKIYASTDLDPEGIITDFLSYVIFEASNNSD